MIPRPGGATPAHRIGPRRGSIDCQTHLPAGSLFDPVMPSAQTHEVFCSGGPVGPWPGMIEVAEASRHRAPGKPAAAVSQPDQSLQLLPWAIRVRRHGAVAEQRPGRGVACGSAHRGLPSCEGVQPRAGNQQRVPCTRAKGLHEASVRRSDNRPQAHRRDIAVLPGSLRPRRGSRRPGWLACAECRATRRGRSGIALTDAHGLPRKRLGWAGTRALRRRRRLWTIDARSTGIGLFGGGEDERHIDGGVGGDEIHEGLAPGLLKTLTQTVLDVTASESIHRGPAHGSPLRGEGAGPAIDTRRLGPSLEPTFLTRSLSPPPQQVRADPSQGATTPLSQGRRSVGGKAILDRGKHRGGHLARCLLELGIENTRRIPIEQSVTHGAVDPGHPRTPVITSTIDYRSPGIHRLA